MYHDFDRRPRRRRETHNERIMRDKHTLAFALVAAAVMIGAGGGGMLMSFECSDAVGFIPEPTNDLGVWQSGDENISSPGSTYSSAFFNVTEQYLPDNTTFYITAGSTVTITNLFDSTGTLLDGFADEGGYNSGTGVWNKITRTFENGDGTFTFEWNSATASGPTITIVVVDTEFTPELGTSENPYTGEATIPLVDGGEVWVEVDTYVQFDVGRNSYGFDGFEGSGLMNVGHALYGTVTTPGDYEIQYGSAGASDVPVYDYVFTLHVVGDVMLEFLSDPTDPLFATITFSKP